MKRSLPTGRSGQTIAVLLVLLTAGIVWRLLATPLIDLYDARRDDLDHRALQAVHLQALADSLPRLKISLGADAPPPVMTLEGATDSIAAASLQGSLQDMGKAVGANLGSVEIVPPEMAEGLRRIGLKVTLTGSSQTVMRLLAAIEQAEPPILVDELQIHGNGLTEPGQKTPSDKLETSFTVYAFRRTQAEGRRP